MTMFNPPHPGGIIEENLKYYELSINAAARALQISPSTLHRVLRGDVAISPEMAIRLETAGVGTAPHWLAMQAAYDVSQARNTMDLSGIQPFSAPVHPAGHHA